VVENFRCTERPGPYRGGRASRPLLGPGPWGFSLTSLMDDPALIHRFIRVWIAAAKLSRFWRTSDTVKLRRRRIFTRICCARSVAA